MLRFFPPASGSSSAAQHHTTVHEFLSEFRYFFPCGKWWCSGIWSVDIWNDIWIWVIGTSCGVINIILDDVPYDSLLATLDVFREIGVHVERLDDKDSRRCSVRVTSERNLKPATITTQPHPGFPTDLQAQLMALLCLAQGNSVITEKIYLERFLHVAELSRMGAHLNRQGPTVIITGGSKLIGAPVMASDLRASASLVLAGLAAEGETLVTRVYHLDRGYYQMEKTLNSLGARIERLREEKNSPVNVEAAANAS